MPVSEYEVIVGISRAAADTREMAVAEAIRHLTFADSTNVFGHRGCIFRIDVYGGADDDEDWGIGVNFDAMLIDEEEMESFERELDSLARVETFEQTGGHRFDEVTY